VLTGASPTHNPLERTLETEKTSAVTFSTNPNNSTLEATTGQASSSSSNQLESSANVSNNESSSDFLSSTTFTDTDLEKSRNVTKDLIVKKQLMHDVQKLKIELSQKNLLIDTLKVDHANVVEDLEEKYNDAMHQRQMSQAKFETQLRMIQNNATAEIRKLKAELQESLKVQKINQAKCDEMAKRGSNLSSFEHIELNDEEYLVLKGKRSEDLSSNEYFSLILYDNMHPLRVQIETLEQRIGLLTSDLRDKEQELVEQKKLYEDESEQRNELNVRCQQFQIQLQDLKSQLAKDTYQTTNFDHVVGERDSLDRRIVDLEKTCTVYKAELEMKSNEMEALRKQSFEQIQSISMLTQDKEYLNKQLHELNPRYNVLIEKYETVCSQLNDAKQAREELYEKYVNSREHYKQEYELRLKQELDSISTKTSTELQKIKDSSKEMYERENRGLRETKDHAVGEQERLAACERELQARYNQVLGEYRQLQISSDSKISECHNEAKLKAFELDRVQLLYEESLTTVKEYSMKNDVLSNKLEALNKEYYALTASTDKRIAELENKSDEYRSKLTIYEKLETELDDVVMQAAEITDEGDAERVLFAYGYGANVPSTAKRRMQQSVQLARRVLHLERANTSLRHEVERETKKSEQLSKELKKTTDTLNEAQQPYNYLIGSIQSRDEQNEIMKKTIETLQNDVKTLRGENTTLKSSNDQMSSDLERLLNRREEMTLLKQMVLDRSRNPDTSSDQSTVLASRFEPSLRQMEDINTVKAKPVAFTKTNPKWFQKLQNQNRR